MRLLIFCVRHPGNAEGIACPGRRAGILGVAFSIASRQPRSATHHQRVLRRVSGATSEGRRNGIGVAAAPASAAICASICAIHPLHVHEFAEHASRAPADGPWRLRVRR